MPLGDRHAGRASDPVHDAGPPAKLPPLGPSHAAAVAFGLAQVNVSRLLAPIDSPMCPAPALPSVAEGRLRSLPDRAPSVLARPKLRGCAMAALLSGHARCSTDQQSLSAQRAGVTAPGVASPRIYDDHGLTGTNRERPGLREALAAGREGDTLVVTKLDRLATRRPSNHRRARRRQVRLSLGGAVHHPDRRSRQVAVQRPRDDRRVRGYADRYYSWPRMPAPASAR